jgi:hypothetical protein
MSEVMRGVLLMPPSLWSGDPLDVQQRHSVYRAAAARIDALEAEVERLTAELRNDPAVTPVLDKYAEDCQRLFDENERLRALIADDAHAASFQSLGQYRAALLRTITEGQR